MEGLEIGQQGEGFHVYEATYIALGADQANPVLCSVGAAWGVRAAQLARLVELDRDCLNLTRISASDHCRV
ncbi:hypothetical protein Dimus_010822 [Dionaea muscipula]